MKILIEEKIPFLMGFGLNLENLEKNRAKLSLKYNEKNLNHIGTLHAGALFTFGETCGGVVVGSSVDLSRYVLVTKDATIKYIKPAITNISCEVIIPQEESERAIKEIEEKGRTDFSVSLRIVNDTGETVAEMDINYVLKKRGG